jgi:maltooligosyltrehalose trehalohydrolase
VWAPAARAVELVIGPRVEPTASLRALGHGYFGLALPGVAVGARYGYRLDGGPVVPDPASRSQPDGVSGRSMVVAPDSFDWTDTGWAGVPAERLVFYELHVGTFSRAGTFDAVGRELPRLQELGITALELMPVVQFPGRRNWGYDGVYPFAVQHSYGGLSGLQRLADACHREGLALFADGVYNHVGPEGNHLARFGPYFTDRYRTPWGAALNFDGAGSDDVRRFFLESATSLVRDAHLDGLRVDAVHSIVDPTASPFLAELTRAVHEVGRARGRPCWLVAESSLNDPRVVWSEAAGGWGFDAMWNDDFHHALHVALTRERTGYLADFSGTEDLRRVLVQGFSLDGRYSTFRGRRHGRAAGDLGAERFVVFSQNHDQVGNRPFGDRLGTLVSFEQEKLAAGITLLAPYVPLLFMGSEYGETAPFQYFTDHAGRRLAAAVRRGRRAEFAASEGGRNPPDPQAPATFVRSRLDPRRRSHGRHRQLYRLHAELLQLRRTFVPTRRLAAEEVGEDPLDPSVLLIQRARATPFPASLAIFRFGGRGGEVPLPPLTRPLNLRLASAAREWGGPGTRVATRLPARSPSSVWIPGWSFAFYGQRT